MLENKKEYLTEQLERVKLSPSFSVKIKIVGGRDGQTNWLSITNEDFLKIQQILINSK